MKRILFSGIFLFIAVLVTAQDQKKAKEYPGFQREESKANPGDVKGVFVKNLEMQSDDELRMARSERDNLDFVHDKYQQYYKKIKVEGAVYSVHSRNNAIESYSGAYKGIRNFDVTPSISASQGLQNAIRHVGARIYAWDSSVRDGYPDYITPKGELVIIGGTEADEFPLTLAWKYDIYAADPLYRAEVFIDAKTGGFVKENQLIHNANVSATGATLFNGIQSFTADLSGTAYILRQTASGGGVETYSLKNGTSYTAAIDITSSDPDSWGDATAVQAHWGAEQTYAYFNTVLNRNSFNNAGAVIKSYVHYSTNYVNAFWDGSRMTYGDGDLSLGYLPLVSLDICGHEITHGVTTYSANLTYSNESGALNESFSDIFGESIENFAKGSNDWMMSCDIGATGCAAFRNMMNPNEFADPDTYKGTYWYTGTADYGGVHTNSGVQNKWFYVLAIGETGTNDKGLSYNVTGIGIIKAANIAYRNLTVYLSASSTYAVARVGSIQAATDLYGAGSAEVIATTGAWDAVGVYVAAADTQAPTAPVLSSPSKTQISIALSWTAATDNVGVTGYDVYVNGIKNNSANLTARTYTVPALTPSTQYSIYVTAKDAAGNTKNSNTLSITTSGAMVETLVMGSYFETSLDNWVASSTTNCIRITNSTYAFEGMSSVLIQSRSTNATTPTLSLAGYSQVECRFYFTAVGMESKKSFVLSYSSNNGKNWSTIATFTSASSASGTKFVTNKGFYVATITMNSTSFNSTAKYRIQNNGSDASDKIYFDAVTVKGRTNTTGTGNVVTLAAATKTGLTETGFTGPMNNISGTGTGEEEIVLYPNPVISTLHIQSAWQIKAIRIFSSNGSIIRTVLNIEDNGTLDLSTLGRGIYIIEMITDQGSVKRKIIKQ
jgi:Zn-dependent metalloprotease